MKQTAVEWLAKEIEGLDTAVSYHYFKQKVEQANEMFEKQIEDAFYQTELDEFGDEVEFERYYNETFKQK